MLRIFVHPVNYGRCSGGAPSQAYVENGRRRLNAQSQQSCSACLQCIVMQAWNPQGKRGTALLPDERRR